jgi:hypothetical protein
MYSDNIVNTWSTYYAWQSQQTEIIKINNNNESNTIYSGWIGYIEFKITPNNVNDSYKYDLFSLFNDAGITIGTGNTNVINDTHHYNVILYEDDWPGLVSYRVLDQLSCSNYLWKNYKYESYEEKYIILN